MGGYKRRDFLKTSLAGLSGAALGATGLSANAQDEAKKEPKNPFSTDPVGRVKLFGDVETSRIGMGTGMIGYNHSSQLTRMDRKKGLAELNKAYQAFLETNPSADSILAFTDKFDELSWQFEQEGDLNTSIDCEKEMLRIYDVVWNGPVHRKAFRMWSIGYKYRELEVTDSADSYLNNAIEMSLECTKDSGINIPVKVRFSHVLEGVAIILLLQQIGFRGNFQHAAHAPSCFIPALFVGIRIFLN